MAEIIILLSVVTIGYFLIITLVAIIKGIGRMGRRIISNFPRFLGNVFSSIFMGVATGFIVGIVTGGDQGISSATGIGIAAARALFYKYDDNGPV
jgi:hypothetical protein